MAFVSREDFIQRQKEIAEKRLNDDGPRVGYFKLENDGDEAVVRFAIHNEDDIFNNVITTHAVKNSEGKFRKVNCLRGSFKDPISDCPLCAAGVKPKQSLYVKLIEYTRDENGKVVSTPKIWERGANTEVPNMLDYLSNYGDLNEMIFKVKRRGAKKDLHTTYSVMPASSTVYNESLYPKNDTAFDGYSILGSAVLDKKFEDLEEMAGTTKTEAPRKPIYQ